MAFNANHLWSGLLLIEMLAKALPFAFSNNFEKFFANLPFPEIIFAISTYTTADSEITDWGGLWRYFFQKLFNYLLENITRNDFENSLQQILRIPSSIWELIALAIGFSLVVWFFIWIVFKIIESITDMFKALCIAVPEICKPFCIAISEICKSFFAFAGQISKYVCVLIPVVLIIVVLIIVVLLNSNRFRQNPFDYSQFLFHVLQDSKAVLAFAFDKLPLILVYIIRLVSSERNCEGKNGSVKWDFDRGDIMKE
ncbi:hypothetical protein BTUL_0172g00290 [Botrytis tulipae]|uniref:Uncharacterized protein n=1 Tax=Botrytis tulipae TaxID=87230 RepID=A0A4Z1EAN6_9HELO|nr:hypothetical protein BTUL_0172g00290 [Botrytis tulipae]